MFTDEEKKLLSDYVTSTEANIFAVRNLPGMVGAAYARYSRAKGGFREVLLKEFIREGVVDPKHADQLIQRILIAYGDDSVGELEPAHMSFERISILAAKEIEDRRIGGSPIEQSTRYVFYDQKDDSGNWLYYRGDEIVSSAFGAQYVKTMDFIFQTYAELIDPLKAHFEKLKPLEQAQYDVTGDGNKVGIDKLTDPKHLKAFKITYNFDLRAKACDVLRSLLPLSTLTNVGILGNGRFFQYLISSLLTSDMPEHLGIAAASRTALNEVIPVYIRRAERRTYNNDVRKQMRILADELIGTIATEIPHSLPSVELMDYQEDLIALLIKDKGLSLTTALNQAGDISMFASMLYPYTKMSLNQLRKIVSELTVQQLQKVRDSYTGNRTTRRDRPDRALEDGYPYTFDLVTNFGVFKDLQRHRMNTQQRQLFTTKLGFYTAPELADIGAMDKVSAVLRQTEALYEAIAEANPELAQYAVLHGNYVRWTMGFNDREAMHLLELRSTPQGHPDYRLIAQLMHTAIRERSPWRAGMMKFVDHNDYYWSRADSEAKQRVKEQKLDNKINAE